MHKSLDEAPTNQPRSQEPALASGLQSSLDEVAMPFVAGQVIAGKYEVIRLIGAGAMGFVVAAHHIDLDEKVALKFLRPEALANQELVARFAREARASVRIKSEYVARVFDVGTLPDGEPFIVMEHLDGKDLGAVLRDQGALPAKVAIEYVLQACEALASAHANGIVHRDVKPENLFLASRAQGMAIIKVLDFGISKVALTGSAIESRFPLVRTMMPMGSPVYMSPEQIRASNEIDARTDIWSLGCLLYEMLTGHAAFDAPSLTQIAAMILEQEPAPIHERCPGISPTLAAVVARCLAKDPNARFANVAELAIALYPHGPRRGRVSVERCCFVLRSAGHALEDTELPSLFPASIAPPGRTSRTSMEVTAGTAVSVTPSLSIRASRRKARPWPLLCAIGAVVSMVSYWATTSRYAASPAAAVGASAQDHGRTVEEAAPNGRDRDLGSHVEIQPVPAGAPSALPVPATSATATTSTRVNVVQAAAERPRSAPAARPKPPAASRPSAAAPLHEQDIGF